MADSFPTGSLEEAMRQNSPCPLASDAAIAATPAKRLTVLWQHLRHRPTPNTTSSHRHTLPQCCTQTETPACLRGRATPEATASFVAARRLLQGGGKVLGRSGLRVSPIGFGGHYLDDTEESRQALALAFGTGVNVVDVAPNYMEGNAERAVGAVLAEMCKAGALRREEIVVVSKVGNVVGQRLAAVKGFERVAKVREDAWHCIDPAWIAEEITQSLARLQLECIDVLLLHCPEFESRAQGVSMDEVYRRMQKAFAYLEREVASGRIARYGVTAAFYPLRPSDPEHLCMESLVAALPAGNHHFEVIQCPFNFAEPQALQLPQVTRNPDGSVLAAEGAMPSDGVADPLMAIARRHGLGILTNRPLNGIYGELQGVVRFASEVPVNSELQPEDADALEAKLTVLCSPFLGPAGEDDELVTGQLAAKTVKVLACVPQLDCVLLGMHRPQYVASVVQFLSSCGTPVPEDVAVKAVTEAESAVCMWLTMAAQEADHGTAKDWRLPERPSGVSS